MQALDWSHRAKPKASIAPELHDVVVVDEHPAGFPRWMVIDIPPHAAPSDVATLQRIDRECPIPRIRRRVNTIRLAKE